MSEWSEAKLSFARAVWGMLVGTALALAALYFVPDVLADGLTRDEFYLIALFVVFGYLLASPKTAFELIGQLFEIWRSRREARSEEREEREE